MQLPQVLMLCIAVATGLVGLLFLLVPERIRRLEARLNAPWGGRELAALRFGLSGERDIEHILNRDVLSTALVWDEWLLRYPRVVGLVLCLLAAWLGWQPG